MKILVDKPHKTVLYVITLLLFGTITLNSDASLRKNICIIKHEKVSAKITEPSGKVDNEVVVAEVAEEVVSPEPRIKPMIQQLSRGGNPPKELTERDIINTYARTIALKYNLEPELIMSMIQTESRYNPKAKNGNCLGLMQVSTRWHADRAARLGVTDFYDPYSNILLGADYISELLAQYKDIRLVLMLYNMNHDDALRLYKNGQITDYAKAILERAEQWKKGE